MDEQLKRRLVGAVITVALLVIFVPMLFEDPQQPAGGTGEVPALPEAIEERTIDLPKSAADVVPEEATGKPEKGPQSGYRIVPLDDAPPKPAKAQPAEPPKSSAAEVPIEAPVEEDAGEDMEEAPVEKPMAKPPATEQKATAAVAGEAPPKKPKIGTEAAKAVPPAKKSATQASPAGAAPARQSSPAAPQKPRTAAVATRPAEVPANKVEKPKSAEATAPKPPSAKPEAPKSSGSKPSPGAEAARSAEAAPSPEPSPAPKSSPTDPAGKPSAAPAKQQDSKRAGTAQEPSAPTSWSVQAGTFVAEANAQALADKLRKQNLPATVRPFHGETATVYRVTVGSGLNRARAEQIQKQIEAATGIRGMLLPRR